MTKLSVIQREKKRFSLYNKYFLKYIYWKNNIKKNKKFSLDSIFYLNSFKFPRNSNPTRIRNRCCVTGRPRGVYRRFGVSRCLIRDLACKGFIPGLLKSCW